MNILKSREECDHVQFVITEKAGPKKSNVPHIDEIHTFSLGKFLYSFYVKYTFLLFAKIKKYF